MPKWVPFPRNCSSQCLASGKLHHLYQYFRGCFRGIVFACFFFFVNMFLSSFDISKDKFVTYQTDRGLQERTTCPGHGQQVPQVPGKGESTFNLGDYPHMPTLDCLWYLLLFAALGKATTDRGTDATKHYQTNSLSVRPSVRSTMSCPTAHATQWEMHW